MLIKPSKEYKPLMALLSQNKVKYYKKCKNFTVNFLITRTILLNQWLLQKYLNCSILKKIDSSNLDGEISMDELGKALKKMKNNTLYRKDGISADF